MMFHHRHEHFLRKREELRVEAAEDGCRILGQVHERVFE